MNSQPSLSLAHDPRLSQLLRALFELATQDVPAQAGGLARLLGLRSGEVSELLVQLDALGLVRAERARLTLVGLAVAARLPALAHVPGEHKAEHSQAGVQADSQPGQRPFARVPEGALRRRPAARPIHARAAEGAPRHVLERTARKRPAAAARASIGVGRAAQHAFRTGPSMVSL